MLILEPSKTDQSHAHIAATKTANSKFQAATPSPGSFDSNKCCEDHGMLLLVHVLIKELLQRSLRGSGLHSRTFKERAYLPDCKWPQAGELAE